MYLKQSKNQTKQSKNATGELLLGSVAAAGFLRERMELARGKIRIELISHSLVLNGYGLLFISLRIDPGSQRMELSSIRMKPVLTRTKPLPLIPCIPTDCPHSYSQNSSYKLQNGTFVVVIRRSIKNQPTANQTGTTGTSARYY